MTGASHATRVHAGVMCQAAALLSLILTVCSMVDTQSICMVLLHECHSSSLSLIAGVLQILRAPIGISSYAKDPYQQYLASMGWK